MAWASSELSQARFSDSRTVTLSSAKNTEMVHEEQTIGNLITELGWFQEGVENNI